MKKTILIALSIIILSFTFKLPTEREYIIRIPANQINQYWALIHGQGEELSVREYKAIISTAEAQIQAQAKQFALEDSITKAKLLPTKKDSTKIK